MTDTQWLASRLVQEAWFAAQSDTEANRKKVLITAEKLRNSVETPEEKMERIFCREPTTLVALGIFDNLQLHQRLRERPKTSAELARFTNADPELISRALKHLAAHGLVKEVNVDTYVATDFSKSMDQPLIHDWLRYGLEITTPILQGLPFYLYRTGHQTPTNTGTGPSQHCLQAARAFWGDMIPDPRLNEYIDNFSVRSRGRKPRWYDIYPIKERFGGTYFDNDLLLVDVGGGSGHDLMAVLCEGSSVGGRFILQDKEPVIRSVNSGILPESVTAITHDVFSPQPAECLGAKAYVLHHVLHYFPDHTCAVLLGHLRNAKRKGHSTLIIGSTVVPDQDAGWEQTTRDWMMLAMHQARERTETQWRQLLASVGLRVNCIWNEGAESVMEAVLADEDWEMQL